MFFVKIATSDAEGKTSVRRGKLDGPVTSACVARRRRPLSFRGRSTRGCSCDVTGCVLLRRMGRSAAVLLLRASVINGDQPL